MGGWIFTKQEITPLLQDCMSIFYYLGSAFHFILVFLFIFFGMEI